MSQRYDVKESVPITLDEVKEAKKIVSDELTRNELWRYFAKRTNAERKKLIQLNLTIAREFKNKIDSLKADEIFHIAMYFLKVKNHNYFSTVEQTKIKEERESTEKKIHRKNGKRRMNQRTACFMFMSEFHELKQKEVSTKDAIEILYAKHRSEFWGQKPNGIVMMRYYARWKDKNKLSDKASLSLPRATENESPAQEPLAVPVPEVEHTTIDIFKKIAERAEEPQAVPLRTGNENSYANI